MGAICCKEGADEQHQAPAPAPALAKPAAQPAQKLESSHEVSQLNVLAAEAQSPSSAAPPPPSATSVVAVDPAQVKLSENAQLAIAGVSVSAPQTVAAVCAPTGTPPASTSVPATSPAAALNSPSSPEATTVLSMPHINRLAGGKFGIATQPHIQPRVLTQSEPAPRPNTSNVLLDILPGDGPKQRINNFAVDPPASVATAAATASTALVHTPPAIAASHLTARSSEAGVTQKSSIGEGLDSMECAVSNLSTPGARKVKVETTRRNTVVVGAVADGSSSVSHSHSTVSSQQPSSSPAQAAVGGCYVGGNAVGDGAVFMMGSSAAPDSELCVAGSSNPMFDPMNTSSTPSASKVANSGFMFGAPRLKEHKTRDRKKDSKRSKSHSSGSNRSDAHVPTVSEAISGSKASGSDATAGGGRGVSGISGQMAIMDGGSTADPSIASTDTFIVSSPSIPATTAAQGSPSVPGSSSGARSSTGYKSIGRRIHKPQRIKYAENARIGSEPSSATGSISTTGGHGTGKELDGEETKLTSKGEPLLSSAGGGCLPEAVPEGEEEDEEDEDGLDSRSRRSSSDHLSIMSPPEGSDVENVLMLICNIFQLPVALVAAYRSSNIFVRSTALKLTDDDRWRYSLAQWSMLNPYELRDVLLVPDATQDERYQDYYCVKNEPRLRFFMASPLRSSTGELLGTLCMADMSVRTLEPTNLLVVNNLQTLVIRQLERDMALAQERVESEEATEKLQREMMRALDHFEKCIMFVDTSKPGWEVLYTNMAWEHVTGIPREHVMGRALPSGCWDTASRVPRVHVAGRPLQDFFMSLGGAGLDWSSTAAEVASRAEFTVHMVAVRQKPEKLVSLHLRLATEEATGELEGLLPKGLPGWVKERGNEAHNYFVFVEEVVQQPGVGNSTVYEALAKHVEKVPGLELSHLLGKGGFGSVYYGTWSGMPVAVKMIDNRLTKTNTEGVSLEALMGQELEHPNIVKTIKYVMRNTLNASSMSGSNSRGMTSSARPGLGGLLHSRNRDGGGSIINSRHGSRGVVNPAMMGVGAGGTSGGGVGENGGVGGGAAGDATTSHPKTSKMSYMTSAQPGLSSMTSAQMAAAEDLTSASAMLHLQPPASHMTSDATTVAGGGSYYSSQHPYGTGMDGSSGVPPREAHLSVTAVEGTLSSSHKALAPGTADTSTTTTSGHTAFGPASVAESTASTAAGPPSMSSAGGSGRPANPTSVSSPNISAAHHATTSAAMSLSARSSGHLAMQSRSVQLALPGQQKSMPLPPPAVPGAPPITAPGLVRPQLPPPAGWEELTPNQQHAAMTSRFSLAFSTITSGGEVLVPGKGSHSPSSSSGAHDQPMGHHQPVGSTGSTDDVGEVWIIMEFCDRGSLQDALDRGALKLRKPAGELGETHLPMMVATACEVASALHYLHGKGIVHGDLTAWNVMLCTIPGGHPDRSGRTFVAKVADFGLSRTLDVKSKIKTRTYGTISHMPPECLINGIVSKATDVFAFGVLLWQMYTGLRPWAGMNHGQIIYNVGMKNVQLLFPPGTPPAIADLSSSCTCTEAGLRPSFGEILEKLDNIRASLGL